MSKECPTCGHDPEADYLGMQAEIDCLKAEAVLLRGGTFVKANVPQVDAKGFVKLSEESIMKIVERLEGVEA